MWRSSKWPRKRESHCIPWLPKIGIPTLWLFLLQQERRWWQSFTWHSICSDQPEKEAKREQENWWWYKVHHWRNSSSCQLVQQTKPQSLHTYQHLTEPNGVTEFTLTVASQDTLHPLSTATTSQTTSRWIHRHQRYHCFSSNIFQIVTVYMHLSSHTTSGDLNPQPLELTSDPGLHLQPMCTLSRWLGTLWCCPPWQPIHNGSFLQQGHGHFHIHQPFSLYVPIQWRHSDHHPEGKSVWATGRSLVWSQSSHQYPCTPHSQLKVPRHLWQSGCLLCCALTRGQWKAQHALPQALKWSPLLWPLAHSNFTFLNTVDGKTTNLTQFQIQGVESAREPFYKLSFPYTKISNGLSRVTPSKISLLPSPTLNLLNRFGGPILLLTNDSFLPCWWLPAKSCSKVMDDMIAWLKQEYESIFKDVSSQMTVSHGKSHKYLGMTLDYTSSRQVKVTMFNYIKEILAEFDAVDPKATGTKASAAPDELFKVNEKCEKIGTKLATAFHTLVANTLYTIKCAHPDTCTALSFLMNYLCGTKELALILSANKSGIIKWYVVGSFGVHPNMKGHTGSAVSFGRGFAFVTSTKQKLNTRSSTESEIVAMDNCMPAICWTRYFLESQGYGVYENILYQDNQSAILLEKNGKASSSKCTKHINIRYFFVTDRINNKEMSVEWCPTGHMIADYMTKPVQGTLFKECLETRLWELNKLSSIDISLVPS